MFRIMLLASWTVLVAYVSWRAATVPAVRRRMRPRLLLLLAALIWASFAVPALTRWNAPSLLSSATRTAAEHLLAALFITASLLLAVDCLTAFGLLFRRRAPRLRGVALAAGAALSVVALVQGLRAPAVSFHEVSLAGLPPSLDGTVLVALSDLHVGGLVGERWLARRVRQAMDLNPDLVVLLGDNVEGHGRPDPAFVPVLGRLRAPLGVWAVAGNHESHGPEDAGVRLLNEAGIRVLHDEAAAAAPGLVIAGITDRGRLRGDGNAAAVTATLGNAPPGAVILLSHRPEGLAEAAAAGAGLMLSGHTHGGQVWPFGWIIRLTTPYVAGRYRVDGMTALVSRGTGSWGPRMRLFSRGEILRIRLRGP